MSRHTQCLARHSHACRVMVAADLTFVRSGNAVMVMTCGAKKEREMRKERVCVESVSAETEEME